MGWISPKNSGGLNMADLRNVLHWTIEHWKTGRYSMRPLITRYGSWKQAPTRMQEYIIREGMMDDWKDVLDIITEHQEQLLSAEFEADVRKVATLKSRIWRDRPIYGPPLTELFTFPRPEQRNGSFVPVWHDGARAAICGDAHSKRVPGLRGNARGGRRAVAAGAN